MFPTTLSSARKLAHEQVTLALSTQQKLVDWQLGNVRTAVAALEQGVALAVDAQQDALAAIAPETD